MHSRSQKLHLAELIRDRGRGFLRFLALLAIVAVGFLGSYFILKLVLNAEYQILPVSSDNMCTVQNHRDGFAHTFERTLHIGDLVMVQGVEAKNLGVTYPNSDVVVLHAPKKDSHQADWLIITRIITSEERNGIIYFRTKGDGEGFHIWPEIPDISECNWWYDYRENYT